MEGLIVNLIPAINQMKTDIQRYKNMRDEKYRDLRAAYWTLSKYSEMCECNKGKNPDYILEDLFKGEHEHCKCCGDIGYVAKDGEINVIPAMKTILDTLKDNEKKLEKQTLELEAGLKVIREMNTTCERCRGTGVVAKPRPNVYCDREYMDCPDCKGKGEINK